MEGKHYINLGSPDYESKIPVDDDILFNYIAILKNYKMLYAITVVVLKRAAFCKAFICA